MRLQTFYSNDHYMTLQESNDGTFRVCGSEVFLREEPLVLMSKEDFSLIKTKSPSQNILYVCNKEWTLDEAREYLLTLINTPIDLLENTSLFNMYQLEIDETYQTKFPCDGLRKTNLVSFNDVKECNKCGEIELSTKCAFCPISFRCPVCGCIDKQNVCYMHQAEVIAILILSQKEDPQPKWVFRSLIPDSWVKQFGKDIYDKVNEIRSNNIINILYESDLLFVYKILIDISCGKYDNIINFLSKTQLSFKTIGQYLKIYVDNGTLDYMEQEGILHGVDFDIQTVKPEVYQNGDDIDIREVTFGKDIPIHIGRELGNPHNPFTYSILYYMRDYITSDTEKVLDIGCGNGATSIYARKCGAQHITAIDIDDSCIRKSIKLANESIPNELDCIEFLEDDIFKFIPNTKKKYNVIVGNLCYSMQKRILPIISEILEDDGIYILGGCPILTENRLLADGHNNLDIVNINYIYNSMIIIFRKRDKHDNL